jgi:hypothetical protein
LVGFWGEFQIFACLPEVFSVVDYPNCQEIAFKGTLSDKIGKIFVQIGKMGKRKNQSDAQIINQRRRFIRECVRISIKSVDFRTKRASFKKKRSKTIENVRKHLKNGVKRSKTFENIRKYSTFLDPPAHLIDFSVSHEDTKTRRKINTNWHEKQRTEDRRRMLDARDW